MTRDLLDKKINEYLLFNQTRVNISHSATYFESLSVEVADYFEQNYLSPTEMVVRELGILILSEEFHTVVRFELVNSYLVRKRCKDLQISKALLQNFEYLYHHQMYFLANKLVSLLIFFSIKDEHTIEIINQILSGYVEHHEIDDNTIFYEIQTYIKNHLSQIEIETIKKQYKDFLNLDFL